MIIEGPLNDIELSRFNYFVDKKGVDDCWNWKGYKLKSGHGQFRHRGQLTYAYRIAYFIVNPLFDQSLCVLHKCDNGACVNPNHLFLGTLEQNMEDKKKKGRTAVGTEVGGLLTEEDVISIRKEYALGNISQSSLARRYGCNQSQISRVISGRRWRHIEQGVGTFPAIK